MELLGKCLAWLGFSYLSAVTVIALYLLLQLDLSFMLTLGYLLVVAVLAGLPYLILVLLNRLILGAFTWLPWHARNVGTAQSD
jgi:hypothetical protein